MKNINRILVVFLFSIGSLTVHGQIKTGDNNGQTISLENPFLDASSFIDYANSEGKGLVFPRTDLTLWEFNVVSLDGFSTFPTAFDGMIVYNTGTGETLTTVGNNPNVASLVQPGFYYFSNPTGSTSVEDGRWLPVGAIGGDANAVKTKTVTVTTPAVYNEAILNLGTSVIGSGEVGTFLGAKIYQAGKLIMTADSDYVTLTNKLTTGNGMMYQVLKPNTEYTVVVEYKTTTL